MDYHPDDNACKQIRLAREDNARLALQFMSQASFLTGIFAIFIAAGSFASHLLGWLTSDFESKSFSSGIMTVMAACAIVSAIGFVWRRRARLEYEYPFGKMGLVFFGVQLIYIFRLVYA